MRRFRNNGKNGERPLIVHGDPKGIGSEAFRTLRTNLQFISPDRELKTILVTSVGPGDGKSTISSNLAVAWAQSGKRVILVDCDLRKGLLDKVFSIPNTPGLTANLTGQINLDDVIVPIKEVPNLDVIPAGPIPPNPAELLQSGAMTSLIETLKKRYDLILFDGAPVIAVTDAAIVANKVDGTVLVIRVNEVPKEVALHAKSLLDRANAQLLGVVLNGVRPHDHKNYQYYYYYENAE